MTHLNSGFLDRLPTKYIIGRTISEWQNDYGAVSVPKDSIQTRVVTVDTTKDFIIPIEIMFV